MSGHTFCRLHLTEVMKEVRPHTTALERKAAWTYHYGHSQGEFHAHDGFYWYGSAHCKYEARAKGWEAWLRHKGIEE